MSPEDMLFIKVAANDKKPIEHWRNPNNQYMYSEILPWVQSGNNYGVVCGHNRLVVVDIDHPTLVDDLGIKPYETLAVKTGSGGYHLYYQVDVEQPTKAIIYYDGQHLGEIQGWGQFVVGMGSTHPNGNQYVAVNPSTEITTNVKYEELVDLFNDAGATCSETTKKTTGNVSYTSGNAFSVTDVWSVSGFKKTGDQYVGSHPVHGSKTGHNLVINSTKDCWKCFRHQTGGGPYEALAVDMGLIDCSESVKGCLKGRKFVRMVEEALTRRLYVPGGA
jgi:hypothetical protein